MLQRVTAGPTKGRLITMLGVFVLTPDALFIRLIDTDEASLMFGRGIFIILAAFALIACAGKRQSEPRPLLKRSELVAGMFYGASSCLFVPALMNTSVASALVIIAASPLIAALAARFIFGDQVVTRTWWATAGIVTGLGIIFQDGLTGGGMFGNLCALGVAAVLAGYFLTLERHPEADNKRAMIVGACTMIGVSAFQADPMSFSLVQWVLLAILGLFLLPIAFLLIGVGPRYIPAAEVSLLMLLESVLGPLWVFLVLGEVPSTTVMAGAALILSILAWHQWPRKQEAIVPV